MKYLIPILFLAGCSSASKIPEYVSDGNGGLHLKGAQPLTCLETGPFYQNMMFCSIGNSPAMKVSKNDCDSFYPIAVSTMPSKWGGYPDEEIYFFRCWKEMDKK